jgi:hypothetical protein
MLVEQVMSMKWCFGIKAKINFQKIPKTLDLAIKTTIQGVFKFYFWTSVTRLI